MKTLFYSNHTLKTINIHENSKKSCIFARRNVRMFIIYAYDQKRWQDSQRTQYLCWQKRVIKYNVQITK